VLCPCVLVALEVYGGAFPLIADERLGVAHDEGGWPGERDRDDTNLDHSAQARGFLTTLEFCWRGLSGIKAQTFRSSDHSILPTPKRAQSSAAQNC
jgi:hypothetical protein